MAVNKGAKLTPDRAFSLDLHDNLQVTWQAEALGKQHQESLTTEA